MKKFLLFSFSALALLCSCFTLKAQTYGTVAVTTCPSAVILNTSSNFSAVIDTRYNRHVTLDIFGRCLTATNTTFVLTCVRSLDAATFESSSLSPYVFTLTIPTNGITYHLLTNIDVGACGFLIPTNAAAGASGTVTNCGVTVALKPGN